MGGTGVIDNFLGIFTSYIDSGFGLLGGEVAFIATTLIVIDVTLAALFWAWGADDDITARLVKKTLFVGVFAYIISNWNNLARIVFESFAGLGLMASGTGFSAADLLRPGRVAQTGLEAGRPLLESISDLMGWIAVFENLVQYSTSGVPQFLQRGGVAALNEGDAFLAGQAEQAGRCRDALVDRLIATGRVKAAPPQGAFYLFFEIDGVTDTKSAALRIVDEANVGLAPGTAFGPGGEGFFRACFHRRLDLIEEADGLVFGSPTINGDAVKPVWDLLSSLTLVKVKGKFGAAFGSYGWSGEAVGLIEDRLRGLKLRVPRPGVKVKLIPTDEELAAYTTLGRELAEHLVGRAAPRHIDFTAPGALVA